MNTPCLKGFTPKIIFLEGEQIKNEIPVLRQEPTAFGHHVLLCLYDCDTSNMSNLEAISNMFRIAAKEARCNVVNDFFHPFSPHGLSGVTIISESHFSYHSWDEDGYAAIDLFYCGVEVEIEKAIKVITEFFSPGSLEIQEFQRGRRKTKPSLVGAS